MSWQCECGATYPDSHDHLNPKIRENQKPCVSQPTRSRKYHIYDSSDLFIELENGGKIRIDVRKNGVIIAPINGVKISIASVGGACGIKFTAEKRKKQTTQFVCKQCNSIGFVYLGWDTYECLECGCRIEIKYI